MAEKLAQDTALPGVTFEGGDFASLLQKEFKPSSWAIENRTAIFIFTILLVFAGINAYNGLDRKSVV